MEKNAELWYNPMDYQTDNNVEVYQMSLKGTKKVDTNRVELEITVDKEKFAEALQKAFESEGKKITLPGFRKGKAPRHMIEKMYGENFFFEDALNIVYGPAVEEAITESGLDYVDDKVDFDLVSISKDDGVDFKVVITVKPEVEIEGYKGLKAEKSSAEVSDDEVKAELDRLADRNSRLVTVTDRPAANGDIAVIDYEGFVDGKAFKGGKGESHSLNLGSGEFIPGFEEQVAGHNSGDEFDVNVEFPKEYHAKELAGKPATFKCTLHEIKFRELPALDDEFAKDVSEFDTLDDLKKDIKEKLAEKKEKAAEAEAENALADQLADLMKAEIPAAMIEARIDQSVQDFSYRLQMQGMDINTYLKFTGSGIEGLRDSMREQAEKQVKIRLALEKIAALENLTATDEDVAAEYEKLAKAYNMEADKIKAYVPEAEMKKDIVVNKALDFVKDNAKISVKKSEDKKPAAKTTAKKAAAKADGEEKPAAKKTAAKKPAAAKSTAKKSEKAE